MKALIFDLDGTLVDSVYAHVLAWQLAFAEAGMPSTAGACTAAWA
jgi:beta-phosphoglucomutase-like phosphatase (HAD superfamily)